MTSSEIGPRLDDFARRLAVLEQELQELKRLAQARVSAAEPPAVGASVPPTRPLPSPAAQPKPPVQAPPPPPKLPVAEQPPRGPSFWERWERKVSWEDLFGAKALAWAGGVVTLLGIVFFFVLAVNRGWIGPRERVLLGAGASSLVFGAGLYVRRRFGHLYHSALAAVGAGIAGAYATLLAATALYDLVSRPVALVLAAGIASIGTATAIAWSSELIAGIGLIGALLAPAAIGIQDGELTPIGTSFAALVFAGTALVALARRWQILLGTGLAASLPQAAVLVGAADATDWNVVVVAGVFWLLYLGTAIALQLRLAAGRLDSLPTTFVLVSGVFAGVSTALQFAGNDEGAVLLAVAAVYGACAAILFPGTRSRDLSALLAAVGLAIAAVALADLFTGPTLTVAWAAEAAVLAWLARRVDESRYQIASLAYLAAAGVHALFFEAPSDQLYEATSRPASGVVAVVAVALAGAVFAFYARPWPSHEPPRGVFAALAPLLDGFRASQPAWRTLVGWGAALAALYAGSLSVLGLAQWLGDDVEPAFEWGHVGVTGLWGLAALGVLAGGLRWSLPQLRLAGLAWLGATLLQLIGFVQPTLRDEPRSYAFFVGAAALLAGALLDRLERPEDAAFLVVAAYALASLSLAVAGIVELVSGEAGGIDLEGGALLALAVFYCLLAGLVLRRDRDLSAVLWAPALVVAAYASTELLSGTALVLAWAAAAASLSVLAERAGERRFQLASAASLVLAVGHALTLDAPLSDFFEANEHPANGVPSLVFVVAAALVFGFFSRGEPGERPATPSEYAATAYTLDSRRQTWQRASYAGAIVLALYAGSLAILGLAEAVGGAGVDTNFQRGHTGVSAFWGMVGLVALYAGLSRGLTWLRLAGFGLFGLALAKLFLYDLAFLSSITRALSFLAVGAVLLIGGFFVQRLGAEGRHAT